MDASTLAHVINMRGVRIMGANNSFGAAHLRRSRSRCCIDGYPV
jgi:hypothetical protein